MIFDVITIFPKLLEPFAKESLLARAQEKGLLTIRVHDLREWSQDKHKKVDEKPFGGGLGMVIKVEPIYKAVCAIKAKTKKQKQRVILFTPRGKKFTQKVASNLLKYTQLIFICGRYEGVDERVAQYIADEELSMGDYVTMGGEVSAMTVMETIARLIPGVVGKPEFLKERNIKSSRGSPSGFLEYPDYTRPEIFSPKKGITWKVPRVLLSGNHKKIGEWKAKHGRIIAE